MKRSSSDEAVEAVVRLESSQQLPFSTAPTFAIDIGVGSDGIRISPRYRDHEERYFHDRPYYRNRADCRKVTIERPDGSMATKYRCD